MKYLIATIIVMFSASAYAQQSCEIKEIKQDVNTPAPKELEGATIIVKLKDGTTREMKAEEYKVVPRKQQFKVKERVAVEVAPCPERKQTEPLIVERTKVEKQKNIVSLLLNRSVTDYDFNQTGPGSFLVESRYELAVGLMYQRNVYQDVYLGVQADTNKSLGLNLGYGF